MIGKKIKICKDRENATLMLYRNICNIWHKNVIQISYKNHEFSVCFLLAAGQIQFVYNCKVQPHHALVSYPFHNMVAHMEATATREGI